MEQKESYSPADVTELMHLNLVGHFKYTNYLGMACAYDLKDPMKLELVRESLFSTLEELSQIPANVRNKDLSDNITYLQGKAKELEVPK